MNLLSDFVKVEKSYFHLAHTNIMTYFSIFGNSFDPNILTEELKILPTDYCLKGDNIEEGHSPSIHLYKDVVDFDHKIGAEFYFSVAILLKTG